MTRPTKPGTSPYATGGGGTVLEHRYGALLLSHLLTGDPLPELGSDATVVHVACQASAESDVDDFMVVGRGGDGLERRAFVAVRRAPKLVPSDKRSVSLIATYLPSLADDWSDIRSGRLRIALAGTPTNPIIQLGVLAEIARAAPNEKVFRAAIARTRRTIRAVRDRLVALDKVLAIASQRVGVTSVASSELTWRFLSSITVRQLRLEPPDEADHAAMTARLRAQTTGGTAAEASSLVAAIMELAGGYAPAGAEVNLVMLRRDLAGSAVLGRSSHHPGAWELLDGLANRLHQRTRSRLVDASHRQLELDRSDARESLARMLEAAGSSARSSPPLVVSGAPDVGKSALTLSAAEDLRGGGAAVTAMSLRDLPPTTFETEKVLGAPLENVLAGTDVRSVRLVVIDGAEAALEGRQDLLRDLATAAMRAGLGVAAVTRTDGEHKVAEMLEQAATAAGIDASVPARHRVSGLTRAEISQVTSAFPALGRLGSDRRNTWLLARPGLVDILLRAGPAVALPDRALSEADVFAAVWSQLVRRGESSGGDGVSPDERERALVALARRTLDPEVPFDGLAARALASLRSDGLLLSAGPTAAWNPGDDFASDLVRDFALAWLLRRDGYKPLLSTGDPPRWALRAARLACQAALSAPGDSERARREQQARFDEVAETGGARWSEVPIEAVLTLPDALARAWPALSSDPEQGLATLIRVALQRYAGFGIGDSRVLAPLVELLHDRRPEFDGRFTRSLGEQIVELRLAWLSGLVVSDGEPNPLRARIRDALLEQPVYWDESLIEALAMLGPDLDDSVDEYLRDLAAEHPSHLAPAVESIIAVTSLVQHQPELLADLTEAYYIDLPRNDDWRGGYHPADDGVRGHERRGTAFGSPMAGWDFGPFWQLLLRDARTGLRVINRILDHAAQARVRSPNYLGGELGEPRADGLSGLELELPGLGTRFCTGDSHVWMWYRGSSVGPYPCVSALLAVERFADQLIAIGFGPGEIAKLLLNDCQNLAMPGLVVGMLVRHLENVTDELDVWLSQPPLWLLEFAREVQEGLPHVQGTDPEDTPGRDRRQFNLRDATAFLVLNAMVRGDKARSAALRECGQDLMRRARFAVPGLDPDDDTRDREMHELATVAGWAATFDADTYGPGTLPDGRAIVQHQSPAHIEAALHDHNEGISRIQDSHRLIAVHAVAEDRNTSSQTILADLALARGLLDEGVVPAGLEPRSAPAAVAKSAVLACAEETLTLGEDELWWAGDLLIDCAIDPHVGEYAFEETVNRMEADRSAAAALPALLRLSAQGAPGSPTRARVVEALVASATSEFHEVRQITATALCRVWELDCVPIDGRDRCIHDAALRATEAAARICRLGPPSGIGYQRVSPITGPVLTGLSAIAPEHIRLVYLIAPIAAASGAAVSHSCVRESAAALLDGLLQTHLRGVVHWAEQGHYNDTPRRHFEVARALFSQAAGREPKYLVRHLAAFAGYPTALGPLLQNLSELATYDAVLRSALPRVWPLVLEPVLDALDAGVDPRSDRTSSNIALAGLLPQPALSLADRDPETSFVEASADWIEPSALSPLIDRWIPLGRGSARCVDAMVGLVRTAVPAWQAGVGLAWVAELIGDTFEPLAGRCPFLATWLDELRNSSHLDAAGRATLHRIVDGLAAHGDIRAVAFQQAEE